MQPSPVFKRTLLWLMALLWAGSQTPASAQQHAASATSARMSGREHPGRDVLTLVLETRLDDFVLSDGLTAYQDGAQILLPLGELARLLTLAITVNPASGSASGYVLREDNSFALNLAESLVKIGARESNFEATAAWANGDDIYVSSQLLSRWLPIDFEVNLPTMQLRVKPRETLPLLARLERERQAGHLPGPRAEVVNAGYPRAVAPYQTISAPFIDQTLGIDVRTGNGTHQTNAAYTAYMTADLLGMEGAAYVSTSKSNPKPDWRVTLGRNDPDAGLLGPLHARSFLLGKISIPSVPNVMAGSPAGTGVTVSNRRLDQPTSFDRQSLRGDLPPGWDVTLYYNEALVGFQTSRPDGMYAFDDLPLSFGTNEFLVVFNGPLGQMRSERKSFLLDQSIVKPGEFQYSLVQHRGDDGGSRSIAAFDMGLSKAVAANASFVRMPRHLTGEQKSYSQLGLRGYWSSMILTSNLSLSQGGGSLTELGLKTRLGSFALDLQHTQVHGAFDSDPFPAGGDPLRHRDKLRAQGALTMPGLPKMPVALEAQREVRESGETIDTASGRLSLMLAGTSITNGLSWQRSAGAATASGALQLSRRIGNTGLSGQLAYSLRPDARLDSLALTADRQLGQGYRISASVLHTFLSGQTVVTAGLSKQFETFSLSVNGSYSSDHEFALGMQIFMALGRDPRTGKWNVDALPLAGTGALSIRAFVDRNLNGLRDADEEFVPNAGFIVNSGGRHPSRTNDAGLAFVNRLAPGQYADIALDPATLEDPQWKPVMPGVRVLPRPGLVQLLEFPVASTSEIDGTVNLLQNGKRRGIGDAQIELVDGKGTVVDSARSSSDGFYVLHQVMPGRFTVRISPDQAAKLKLGGIVERQLTVPVDGDFISGLDFELRLIAP